MGDGAVVARGSDVARVGAGGGGGSREGLGVANARCDFDRRHALLGFGVAHRPYRTQRRFRPHVVSHVAHTDQYECRRGPNINGAIVYARGPDAGIGGGRRRRRRRFDVNSRPRDTEQCNIERRVCYGRVAWYWAKKGATLAVSHALDQWQWQGTCTASLLVSPVRVLILVD